jgi:hypothetical protein
MTDCTERHPAALARGVVGEGRAGLAKEVQR